MESPNAAYMESAYTSRIDILEGYVNQLSIHLDRLEELKSQVKDFWGDVSAPMYLDQLTKAIVGVRNAMDRANGIITLHKNVVSDMKADKAKTDAVIEDIAQTIGAIGILI